VLVQLDREGTPIELESAQARSRASCLSGQRIEEPVVGYGPS
jgi:hypothetical protein